MKKFIVSYITTTEMVVLNRICEGKSLTAVFSDIAEEGERISMVIFSMEIKDQI